MSVGKKEKMKGIGIILSVAVCIMAFVLTLANAENKKMAANAEAKKKEQVENKVTDSLDSDLENNVFLITDLTFLCIDVDESNVSTIRIFQNNDVIGEFRYEPIRSDKMVKIGDMFFLTKQN